MRMMQAQEKLDEMTEKQTSKFCPLIRDKCRADCECFVEGWIADDEEEGKEEIQYFPRSPYCTCFALKGG